MAVASTSFPGSLVTGEAALSNRVPTPDHCHALRHGPGVIARSAATKQSPAWRAVSARKERDCFVAASLAMPGGRRFEFIDSGYYTRARSDTRKTTPLPGRAARDLLDIHRPGLCCLGDLADSTPRLFRNRHSPSGVSSFRGITQQARTAAPGRARSPDVRARHRRSLDLRCNHGDRRPRHPCRLPQERCLPLILLDQIETEHRTGSPAPVRETRRPTPGRSHVPAACSTASPNCRLSAMCRVHSTGISRALTRLIDRFHRSSRST